MIKKHRVAFVAEKKVKEPVKIAFKTKEGKKISFVAEKKVKGPVKVKFMAKNKKIKN